MSMTTIETPLMVPVRRAAKRIGVSYQTVKRHPAHFFPIHRLGSHDYVLSADLTAWVEAKMSDTGASRTGPTEDDNGSLAPAA